MKFHIFGVYKRPIFGRLWVKQPPPNPLTQKILQILFDILVANKISRILTKGIVKISRKNILQVKNGGSGWNLPRPQ